MNRESWRVKGGEKDVKNFQFILWIRDDFGKWRRAARSLFSYLLISVLILPKFGEHQLKLGSKLIKIWVSRVEFLSFTRVLLIHIINDGCCSADSSLPYRCAPPRSTRNPLLFLFRRVSISLRNDEMLLLYSDECA